MSISLKLSEPNGLPELGASYFWDAPQVPTNFAYPFIGEGRDAFPMTFIAQINCEEIAALDVENKLPHTGFLYFFGDIDYYLGYDPDADNGLGQWDDGVVAVYYDVEVKDLQRYNPFDDNDTIRARNIAFESCNATAEGHKLLGKPFEEDVARAFPKDYELLFQLDSDEGSDYTLRFYDEGLLYFMISATALAKRDFSGVVAYMTSM